MRRTIRNVTRVFPGVLAGLNVGLPIVRPLAPACVAIDASEVSEEVTICFVSRHFSAQQVSKECALAVLSIHAAVLPDLHITTMRLPDLLLKLDRADVRLVSATLQQIRLALGVKVLLLDEVEFTKIRVRHELGLFAEILPPPNEGLRQAFETCTIKVRTLQNRSLATPPVGLTTYHLLQ